MLIALGRLSPRGTPDSWIAELVETSGGGVKEITPAAAVLSSQLPNDFPADPADRLITAAARAEGLTLITRDVKIRKSSVVKTIW